MKDMTHFGYFFELHMAAILDYGIYDTHAPLNKCLIRFFDLENIGLDISFAFIAVFSISLEDMTILVIQHFSWWPS